MLAVSIWFRLAYADNEYSASTVRNGMFIINVETLVIACLGCLAIGTFFALRFARGDAPKSGVDAVRYSLKAYALLLVLGTIVAILAATIFQLPGWKRIPA
jgi:hypothetical protein